MIITFFMKLMIVLLISLTKIVLVKFLKALVMISTMIIITMIKIMTAITKIVKFFSNNKFSSSKKKNGNIVGTDKTIDSNITFRIKKSKK